MTVLLTLTSNAIAAHDLKLEGQWHATNTNGNALGGTMELRIDGTARLSPSGQETLEGTWETSGPKLSLTMQPYGTATMNWVVSKKGIVLSYENGVQQNFEKKKEAKHENQKLGARSAASK